MNALKVKDQTTRTQDRKLEIKNTSQRCDTIKKTLALALTLLLFVQVASATNITNKSSYDNYLLDRISDKQERIYTLEEKIKDQETTIKNLELGLFLFILVFALYVAYSKEVKE